MAELKTAALLEDEGWVVASRRHMYGPGDLLAVKLGQRPRLIEVKARIDVWQGFRRGDREAMLTLAIREGLEPLVAWWRPRAKTPVYLGRDDWPDGSTHVAVSWKAA